MNVLGTTSQSNKSKSIEWNNNCSMVKLRGKIFDMHNIKENNMIFIHKKHINLFMQYENDTQTIVFFDKPIEYGLDERINNIEISQTIEEIYKLFSLEEKQQYIMVIGKLYNTKSQQKFLIKKEDIYCVLQPDNFEKETIVFLKNKFCYNHWWYNFITINGIVEITSNIFVTK